MYSRGYGFQLHVVEVNIKDKLGKVCGHAVVLNFKVMDQNFVEDNENNLLHWDRKPSAGITTYYLLNEVQFN
jgi:hypothetical protein